MLARFSIRTLATAAAKYSDVRGLHYLVQVPGVSAHSPAASAYAPTGPLLAYGSIDTANQTLSIVDVPTQAGAASVVLSTVTQQKNQASTPVVTAIRLARLAPVIPHQKPGTKSWCMIVNDFTDADALPRRMAARPGHLSAAANMLESGVLVAGGAVLDSHDTSGRMTGSVFLLAGLESADHVRAAFANDPYVVGRVWNMESAEIVQVDLAGLGKLVAAAA